MTRCAGDFAVCDKIAVRQKDAGLFFLRLNPGRVYGHNVGTIEDYALSEWQRILDINLTGVFLGIRAAVKPMKEAGRGSIINISSIEGMAGTIACHGYTATTVRIELSSGLTISRDEDVGVPVRDLAAQQNRLERKYRSLTEPVIGSRAAAGLCAAIKDLDRADGVDAILAACRLS